MTGIFIMAYVFVPMALVSQDLGQRSMTKRSRETNFTWYTFLESEFFMYTSYNNYYPSTLLQTKSKEHRFLCLLFVTEDMVISMQM